MLKVFKITKAADQDYVTLYMAEKQLETCCRCGRFMTEKQGITRQKTKERTERRFV